MQAIKYKWLTNDKNFEPFIFVKNGGNIERIRLMNENISISVGKKHCIGYIRNGRHLDCPHNMLVESGWHCNECRINDDFFLCVKCTGEQCINEKQRPACKESVYFMYLAAFDSMLKVGISYGQRLIERLVEQGADFGAKVAVIKDGMDVRKFEQDVKSYLKIVDRVTGDQKQSMIFGNPNLSIPRIFNAISLLRNNGISQYMVPPEVYDLRDYYKLEQVPYLPSKIKIDERAKVEGAVVAAKGNIVILRNDRGFFSFNSHDLIGRDIAAAN